MARSICEGVQALVYLLLPTDHAAHLACREEVISITCIQLKRLMSCFLDTGTVGIEMRCAVDSIAQWSVRVRTLVEFQGMTNGHAKEFI
jgi:hypothetical protein